MNNDIRLSLGPTMPTPERVSRETRATGQSASEGAAFNSVRAQGTPESASDPRGAQSAGSTQEQASPDREAVEQAASQLARRAEGMGRDLRFEVDDDSGMTVVKVIDRTTKEVVRQIPSEEAVARAADSNDSFNLIDASA